MTLRLYSEIKIIEFFKKLFRFEEIKLLDRMDQNAIKKYHMNEGHSSFLVLGLLEKFNNDTKKVKSKCHFTTHTPVPAGHDQFSLDRVKNLLNGLIPNNLELPSLINQNKLHMTELGLKFSETANGVSRLHGKVAQGNFHGKRYWLHNKRSSPFLLDGKAIKSSFMINLFLIGERTPMH